MNKKTYIICILILLAHTTLKSQNNLSINEAIEIGLKNNYGINIEKKTAEINKINNTWSTAGAIPNLNFNISGNYIKQNGDIVLKEKEAISSSLDINNIVLFNGFAIRNTKKKLDELESLSQENLSLVIENTIAQIIISYYMLVLEKEKLQVMIKVDNLSTDKYEREQKRFSKGIKTTYELLQSKISMLENRSKLLTQQAAYNNSMRDFNFVLANKKDIEYTLYLIC